MTGAVLLQAGMVSQPVSGPDRSAIAFVMLAKRRLRALRHAYRYRRRNRRDRPCPGRYARELRRRRFAAGLVVVTRRLCASALRRDYSLG